MKIKLGITYFSMLVCFSIFAQGPPNGQVGRGNGQGGNQQRGGQQRNDKPDATEILKLLDTNDDDKIDKNEASKDRRGKILEDFDEIDTDGDEFITLEELEASLNNKKPKRVSAKMVLKEVDQNEDGLLNELEVAAKDKRDLINNFSEIDTNEDGLLDIDELKVFYTKNKEKEKKNRN